MCVCVCSVALGQESPLQSVDQLSVHDNHVNVTSSTPLKLNHDDDRSATVRHLHETPI